MALPRRKALDPMVAGAGALLIILAALALLLLTQRALAAELGGFVAGLWVSIMSAIVGLLGG